MKINVLALNGVFDTGLATILDAFSTANELAHVAHQDTVRFEVDVVGMGQSVKTAQGWNVQVKDARDADAPELVIIPALGYKMPETLLPALVRPEVREAANVLANWVEAGAAAAAACIGTFVLAESGLLDGHEATTTWWLAPLFRQRYPKVRLDESRIVVRSGSVLTAGAALSHLDMALWLIGQSSPELAALVARYLVVDSRPSQSAYIIPTHFAHEDPVVRRFEKWARANLAAGFSLDEAASAVNVSKRTLARRLQEVLGKTALEYVQDLRVEQAVHLLKTTSMGVEHIAARVGYDDGATLRTLLRRKLGRGVRELRGPR